jgi:hypothetical protein
MRSRIPLWSSPDIAAHHVHSRPPFPATSRPNPIEDAYILPTAMPFNHPIKAVYGGAALSRIGTYPFPNTYLFIRFSSLFPPLLKPYLIQFPAKMPPLKRRKNDCLRQKKMSSIDYF